MLDQPLFRRTSPGLFTDLYELTMAQAYQAEGMHAPATFSLFFRTLPARRSYILSCGSEHVAEFLERVRFSRDDIAYLREQALFSEAFLGYLEDFGFTGDMDALPDGTPVFPQEPIAGTMAHSYIQAHDSEMAAFRAFVGEFPETVLLVDTYDTLGGVRKVVALARELGDAFAVRGVRLDSGDLGKLARESRRILDDAGLDSVKIFVSGGIDEFEIEALLEEGAPIDGFGVGTAMGVSEDAPALDIAYKLVDYAGTGRMKLSSGKETLPGAKQVYRRFREGRAYEDVIARRDEEIDGIALLEPFVRSGRAVRDTEDLEQARDRARTAVAALPEEIRGIHDSRADYPVRLSRGLEDHLEAVRERIRGVASASHGVEPSQSGQSDEDRWTDGPSGTSDIDPSPT